MGEDKLSIKVFRNAFLPGLPFGRQDDGRRTPPWVKATQGLSRFSGGGDQSLGAVCVFPSLCASSRHCELKRAKVACLKQEAAPLLES